MSPKTSWSKTPKIISRKILLAESCLGILRLYLHLPALSPCRIVFISALLIFFLPLTCHFSLPSLSLRAFCGFRGCKQIPIRANPVSMSGPLPYQPRLLHLSTSTPCFLVPPSFLLLLLSEIRGPDPGAGAWHGESKASPALISVTARDGKVGERKGGKRKGE